VSTRLVCVDKDGTLVENVPYNVDPAVIRLTAGAVDGLRLLHEAGYRLVVISNQPGLALGLFDHAAFDRAVRHLDELCRAAGAPLAGLYHCPHAPDGLGAPTCECRKPMPGLIERALLDHDADREASWMVGDILDDVEAGRRAGLRTVLVDNGGETEWQRGPLRRPDLVAADLGQAARAILALAGSAPQREALPA
jgi:D-glycero-D-manno-heptose 1,7-bisphosphate phosphatase